MKKIALLSLLSILSLGAFAKQQTVMLEVPTMTCVTCPITVEKALQQVEGVTKAEVTFEDKLAVVTFDDEKNYGGKADRGHKKCRLSICGKAIKDEY